MRFLSSFFFIKQDWIWSGFGNGKKNDYISSLAHDVSVSVQSQRVFFSSLTVSVSHTLLCQRLRCRLNILLATATLTATSTGFFVSCVWFFCFSKFIHCFSSPNSSSVIFFCKWFQAVDNIFPKPLIYNLIFDKHPIIWLRKNHRHCSDMNILINVPLLLFKHLKVK